MVRLVVGLFVFAVLLCIYIISSSEDPYSARAQRDLPVKSEGLQKDVAIEEVQPEVLARETVKSTLAYDIDNVSLEYSVANILFGLGIVKNTFGIGKEEAAKNETAFDRAVSQGLNERMSDQEIEALVVQKAQNRLVSVPAALVQADKNIDISTLLEYVIAQALVASGSERQVRQELSTRDDVLRVNGQVFYDVSPSDSLAKISWKFYGDFSHIDTLIKVNRTSLLEAGELQAGQKLLLPVYDLQ